MVGTILVAMREMRVIPPSITDATTTHITLPSKKRSHGVFSIPIGEVMTVVTASTSWLACIKQSVPSKAKMAKKYAMGFHRRPSPVIIMYIGPPCTSPALSRPLYMIDRAPSKNLVHIPSMALTHIQNIAPGPPMHKAMATPAMLPMPTVDDISLIKACSELICPAPSLLCL